MSLAGVKILAYGDSLTAGYAGYVDDTMLYEPYAKELAAGLGVAVDRTGFATLTRSRAVLTVSIGCHFFLRRCWDVWLDYISDGRSVWSCGARC